MTLAYPSTSVVVYWIYEQTFKFWRILKKNLWNDLQKAANLLPNNSETLKRIFWNKILKENKNKKERKKDGRREK